MGGAAASCWLGYPLTAVDSSADSGSEALEPPPPTRPPGVPTGCAWNAEFEKWELCARDAAGDRDGERLLYRGDGTLYSRARFAGGVQEGPFFVYHPNGDVAREGRCSGGMVDGVVSSYASKVAGGEGLRPCCVPPEAARLDVRYRRGEMLLEVFYDGQGRAILSDGRLCPARPASLPELAQFDEARWGWAQRDGQIDRRWSEDGTLTTETERERDGARVERRFDPSGQVAEQTRFSSDDQRDGPFQRTLPPDQTAPYADARVRQERGAYARGQAVDVWTFADAEGAAVRVVDRGVAFDDADVATSPAFAAAGDWPVVARELFAARRVREALAAVARAAVAARDRELLVRAVAEHVMPLTLDREAQFGEAIAQSSDASPSLILDVLICGADVASAFRGLASVLPGTGAAASDFVEASLLLAPDRRMTYLTRALLRFQRGDEAGARADAAVVEQESAEAADSCALTARPCSARSIGGRRVRSSLPIPSWRTSSWSRRSPWTRSVTSSPSTPRGWRACATRCGRCWRTERRTERRTEHRTEHRTERRTEHRTEHRRRGCRPIYRR